MDPFWSFALYPGLYQGLVLRTGRAAPGRRSPKTGRPPLGASRISDLADRLASGRAV